MSRGHDVTAHGRPPPGVPPYARRWFRIRAVAWALVILMIAAGLTMSSTGLVGQFPRWLWAYLATAALSIACSVVAGAGLCRLKGRVREAGGALCPGCGNPTEGLGSQFACPECGRRGRREETPEVWRRAGLL